MLSLSTIPFGCQRTCPAHETKTNGLFVCRFQPLFREIGPVVVHSHVARVKCEIRDLRTLELAARACGLVLNRNQKTYRWYGRSVGDSPLPEGMTVNDLGKCDHALSIPGDHRAYEIGVIKNASGGFDLMWDFWMGGYGMEAHVGKDCGKLVEEYLFGQTIRTAEALGWQVERQEHQVVIYHPESGVLMLTADGQCETSGFVGGACHQAREQLGLKAIEGSIVNTAEANCVPQMVQAGA